MQCSELPVITYGLYDRVESDGVLMEKKRNEILMTGGSVEQVVDKLLLLKQGRCVCRVSV